MWNYRGLMDKVGLLPQTFKSGKYKDMLSGSREPETITQKERDMVQALIDETYGKFKNVVEKGRGKAHDLNKNEGKALNPDWKDYADGRVLSGTEALNLGFVDELGGFDKAVERMKTIAGVSSANLIEYQQRYDLADLLHLFGKTEGKGLKVDLGLEVPRLKAGQLYFLSPTFVQ
jgi:protease-4